MLYNKSIIAEIQNQNIKMILNLKLQNYRNLKNLNINIQNPIICIIAPNGSGKTNILESIYTSVFNQSFRQVSGAAEFIGPEQNFARVKVKCDTLELTNIISQNNNKISKTFQINNKNSTRAKIPSRINVIIFAPHSIDIAGGEPSIRRQDLDHFLSTCYPEYRASINMYNKALKNRNKILKHFSEIIKADIQLKYWTEQLILHGSRIQEARGNFILNIQEYVHKAAFDVYHTSTNLEIEYLPNIVNTGTIVQSIQDKFEQNIEKEKIVGKTLYGIQKDDYLFKLEGKPIRYFASRGQQRISTYIWKRAQMLFLKDSKSADEITILIDDIFSELDTEHRENLARLIIEDNIQTILTGAVISDFPNILLDNAQIVNLDRL